MSGIEEHTTDIEDGATDDNESMADVLLNVIKSSVIPKLKSYFSHNITKSKPKHAIQIKNKLQQVLTQSAQKEDIYFTDTSLRCTSWIDKNNFLKAIQTIFGSCRYIPHAEELFKSLDPFNQDIIWWDQLLDKLIDHGSLKLRSRRDNWLPIDESKISMEQIEHCQKQTILKIVSIETKTSFCYVIVSRNGKVAIYDGNIVDTKHEDRTHNNRPKSHYNYDIFVDKFGNSRRVKIIWITDAVYMDVCKFMVYAASDRSIIIYEALTLRHYPLYYITDMLNIPTCMSVWTSMVHINLYIGDDHGNITEITFQQPNVTLLYKKHIDKMSSYHWSELGSDTQIDFCSLRVWKKLHKRSIVRIECVQASDLLISCSNDKDTSIVIKYRTANINDYVFKTPRGVSSFHYSSSLRILITGSKDGIIRLWDTMLPRLPFSILNTQTYSPVVDVASIASKEIVLGFHRNMILNIWDIFEETCLQTLHIKFPFIGILGKSIEFGVTSIFPGPPRANTEDLIQSSTHYSKDVSGVKSKGSDYERWNKSEIILSACDYIAILKFNMESVGHPIEVTSPLPLPKREIQARRPSNWNIDETELKMELIDTAVESNYIHCQQFTSEGIEHLDEVLQDVGLTRILNNDFTNSFNVNTDISIKLKEFQKKEKNMKYMVSLGTPYMALDLYDLNDIKFTKRNMTITDRMKRKSGLECITNVDQLLDVKSCFCMSTPRSVYSLTTNMSSVGSRSSVSYEDSSIRNE